MKRKHALFLMMCMALWAALTLFPTVVSADGIPTSGTCGDNLTWTLDAHGVLKIEGSGEMKDFSYYYPAPWNTGTLHVRTVQIGDSVNSIGNYAFYQMGLTGVTIGNDVTRIGTNAFYGCTGLTDVTIPDNKTVIGEYAFCVCTGLKTVTIGCDATIRNYAFSGCTGLTSMVMKCRSIGIGAFYGCTGLTSVTIPDGVFSVEQRAFFGCTGLTGVKIPDSVRSISNEAFSGCTGLTDVTIPGSVNYLGEKAFSGCTGLTSVAIGSGITMIGSGAFMNCTALTSVTIPDGVEGIGHEAFSGCTDLTSVYIPRSVVIIVSYAFQYCNSLKEIRYAGTEEEWNQIKDRGYLPVGVIIQYNSTASDSPVVRSCTLSFDPNGGIGSMESVTCEQGTSLWLPVSTFYRAGYTFHGWNTRADGTGTEYQNLAQITPIDNFTLYAQWLGLIAFEQESYEVEEGESIKIFASIPGMKSTIGFLWTPDREESITVSGQTIGLSLDGICTISAQATGLTEGNYILTLTLSDGRSESCPVKVLPARYTLPLYQEREPFQFRSTGIRKVKQTDGEKEEYVDGDIEYYYHYDEKWFLKSSTEYQHDLVRMSIRGAMAAYGADGTLSTPRNIRALMARMKFRNITSSYPTPKTDAVHTENNTIGYAIGSKNIRTDTGDQFSLIMVAVRGGGYYDEWGDNFNIGSGVEHAGFSGAAAKVLTGIRQYLKANEDTLDENRKIWVMGYSRAAATTNIVAKELDNGAVSGIVKDNVFAFCFECPQNTRDPDRENAEKYGNIINIVNPLDFVPKVAMSAQGWSYGRYGKTYYTPYRLNGHQYKEQEDAMIRVYSELVDHYGDKVKPAKQWIPRASLPFNRLDGLLSLLAVELNSPEIYSRVYQEDIIRLVVSLLGKGSAGESDQDHLIETFFKRYVELGFGTVDILAYFAFLGIFSPDLTYAHYPELCLSWLDSLRGEPDYADVWYRMVFINCPVNVRVYNSGNILVGSVTGNAVDDIEDGVCVYIDENGQKVIALPAGEEYTIRMKATDEGTVTYTAATYYMESGAAEQVVIYQNIPIVTGDTLTAFVEIPESPPDPDDPDAPDEPVEAGYTLEKDGALLKADFSASGGEVKTHTVEIRSGGHGAVTGGGKFVMGQYAQVGAKPEDGYQFDGWYIGDTAVSMENPYRFFVDSDRVLTARFSPQAEPVSIESISVTGLTVHAEIRRPMDQQVHVFCAVYQGSGHMVQLDESRTANGNHHVFSFDGVPFACAKVFVLDENQRPLCDSKSVILPVTDSQS